MPVPTEPTNAGESRDPGTTQFEVGAGVPATRDGTEHRLPPTGRQEDGGADSTPFFSHALVLRP